MTTQRDHISRGEFVLASIRFRFEQEALQIAPDTYRVEPMRCFLNDEPVSGERFVETAALYLAPALWERLRRQQRTEAGQRAI